MSSSYHYSDLPEGSVRLVRLLPRDSAAYGDSRIKCCFLPGPLLDSKTAHPFEALSYAWGSEENSKSISVDGCNFLVGANLYSALLHLQDDFIERILWVDALCINQENTAEKGRQVQSMAKIYAKASRVIVWLGEATANAGDEALEYILAVSNRQTTSVDETKKDLIVDLLGRSWFQRAWVVQEVAAARHILVKCGRTEIDGYAFSSGLDVLERFYITHPDLSRLVPPVTYLIGASVFRPRYQPNLSGRFSLSIRPLAELIDMFHARKAKDRRDKVYALLGMSLDDPGAAGLSADYNTSWRLVFQKLITFSLSYRMAVEIWGEEVAVIGGKGCALGKVLRIEKNATQGNWQTITWEPATGRFGAKQNQNFTFTLQASAKSIQPGDIICHLEEAPNPTIIRMDSDYGTIIRIAIPLDDSSETAAFPDDFLLVWDWDSLQHEAEVYDDFRSGRRLATQETDLDRATRMSNAGHILEHAGASEDARRRFIKSVGIYEAFLTNVGNSGFGHANEGAWRSLLNQDTNGYLPLLWAAENGHRAVVQQLLERGANIKAEDKYGRTPLSWASGNGHGAVVQQLLEREANIEAKDEYSQTPLLWASGNGHGAVVQQLLERGANIEAEDRYGQTPLLWASENGHGAVVQQLLERMTIIEVQDNK